MKDLATIHTRCLLVQPEFSKFSSLNYTKVCRLMDAKYPFPPLNLMTVAALLPQTWEFRLIDQNVESLHKEDLEWADLVCAGGMLSQQKGILEMIELAHTYGKKVVIGGPDPSSQPEVYEDADYLVIGEGEITIPLFLSDYKKGKPKGIYKSSQLADMSSSVIPRYDLIDFKNYLFMGLQNSRGCPYNCEFCNVIELYGNSIRSKRTEDMMQELQLLYKLGYRGHVFFVDDNFLANRKNVSELLINIRKWSMQNNFPFFFAAETSINVADDVDMLKLMQQTDFRYLSLGIETPDQKVLIRAQKKQNIQKSIPDVVRKIMSYGMIVDASFIMGFDGEDECTAQKLRDCIQNSGICMAMVGTLYALPNTQLSRRLLKEERLYPNHGSIGGSEDDIDQMTSGLNFETLRNKSTILKEYINVLSFLYSPENYFLRLRYVSDNLKVSGKHRDATNKQLLKLRAFFLITFHLGFKRLFRKHYWNTLFYVLFNNPKSLEAVLSMASLFIHLHSHSRFIIKTTRERINLLDDSITHSKSSKIHIT